jgi:hypothetical protein
VFMHGAARSALLLMGMTVVAGCRKDGRPASDAARETFVPPPPLPAVVSRFDVPLEYDFTPVMKIVEKAVPIVIGSLDSVRVAGTDSSKHFAFTATRGPFTAVAEGNVVRLSATFWYAAKGYYKPPIGPTISAGCGTGEERPRITVDLITPITLTENWHLKSSASIAKLGPTTEEPRDKCRVTFLRFDVTERVAEAAYRGLAALLPTIDKRVAKVDLTKHAKGWWNALNRPIRLTDSVWLVLGPRQLRMGRVRGVGHQLIIQAGLDASPQVITGSRPRETSSPLPPLLHDTIPNGYHIMIDGLVDYGTASRGLTAAMHDRTFERAGKTIHILDVTAQPSDSGRLSISVRFEGDTEGHLRLTGVPVYDSASGEMRVPDLDYDLQTSDQLVNAYAWLRSDDLRARLRDAMHVSVQPALDRGKDLLRKGLNRTVGKSLRLSAEVDSVALRGVYVLRTGLLVRAEAIGNAGVAVRQRPDTSRARAKKSDTAGARQ